MHFGGMALDVGDRRRGFGRKLLVVVDFESGECFQGEVEDVDVTIVHADEEVLVVQWLGRDELRDVQAGAYA